MHDKIIAFAIDKNKSNKFVLFLDDDNRQIKLNQLRIKRNLEQLGYTVQVVTGIGKDPKSCSNKELKEILL